MMALMDIRTEKNNHVWTIIYSRPEARNAMTPENAALLYEAFIEFEQDEQARVAVLFGEGGSFCAGYDLKRAAAMTEFNVGNLPDSEGHTPGPMGPTRLELDKPVIAAIAGPAVAGGMELACWCDFRVMENSAYMGVFCRRWGVPLIDGGTVRLPRLVGQGKANELILTGRKIDAEECSRIGLCEYLVEEGQARAKAEELAAEIAKFPQRCMRADRRSANQQHGMTVREALANEWENSKGEFLKEGAAGAARFAAGKGRHGDFENID